MTWKWCFEIHVWRICGMLVLPSYLLVILDCIANQVYSKAVRLVLKVVLHIHPCFQISFFILSFIGKLQSFTFYLKYNKWILCKACKCDNPACFHHLLIWSPSLPRINKGAVPSLPGPGLHFLNVKLHFSCFLMLETYGTAQLST